MTSWAAGQFDFWGAEEQGTKDLRTRCWLGYATSPLLSLFVPFCHVPYTFRSEHLGGGGGCLSLFQVHFLGGHLFVFIPGAMFIPRWTLRNDHSIASGSYCSRNTELTERPFNC